MRTVYSLFVVSALLFISAIAFVVAGARTSAEQAPAAPVQPPPAPVASISQIMRAIAAPAATVIFESVSTTVSAAGVEEKQPRSDDEWADVASSAAALVEAGNMLMVEGRAIDRTDWITMARAMVTAGNEALEAAKTKSVEGILASGENINTSCDTCHERYWRQ
jgi:hypothetical protein